MEKIVFNGWDCIRLANREIEIIVTRDVGPRIIRLAFKGKPNLFAEIPSQQGAQGEKDWMIRGGHRLWVAPEAKPWSYELDNQPYALAEAIPNGIRVRQDAGPITRIVKQMDITLDPGKNRITVVHTLSNHDTKPVACAPWALSVMGLNGQAIIPLPEKISHTTRLLPNQHWSIWGYTDFTDPRWMIGSRYIFFRQDPTRGPNKLGCAHREKWVAYQREGFLFIKQFEYVDGATYPDNGCNFETFANEEILEIESLGPLVTLQAGASTVHTETWLLFENVPRCQSETDVDRLIRPLL